MPPPVPSVPSTRSSSRTTGRRGLLGAAYDRLPESVRDRLSSFASDASAFGPWSLVAAGFAIGFAARGTIRRGLPREEGRADEARKPAGGKAGGKGAEPRPGAKLKMVMVVRRDLNMSPGKVASQCAHGAVGIMRLLEGSRKALLKKWEAQGEMKIVVSCKHHSDMVRLAAAATRGSLPSYVVSDAGHTEVARGSQTVLVIGPGEVSAIDEITGGLPLL